MSTSQVGPWVKDKLDRLDRYLNAYTTIMRKQKWCEGFVYVDAFAGPGHYVLRQKQEWVDETGVLFDVPTFHRRDEKQTDFIKGSPSVALGIKFPFSYYVFVEKDPGRLAQLEKLKEEYGETRNILIHQGDCNEYLLNRLVNNPRVDWSKWRAVVFLDPFGMQVPWTTLLALGQSKAIEVFLNFPVGMAIQRLLLRSAEFTQKQRAKLDAYFGSPEWYDVLYRVEPNFFVDGSVKVEESGRALVNWYRKRLQSVFGHASKAALIRNTKGGHLYYLLLATANPTGLRIANHILSAGESV
jgi:three-Cys-motif partner protein